MDEIQAMKMGLRKEMLEILEAMPADEIRRKKNAAQERLFEFANFLESKIVLLYVNGKGEMDTRNIIQSAYQFNKIVVLPAFGGQGEPIPLLKVDPPGSDLIMGPRGVLEPDPARCKKVPIDCIDIAIVPGIAFDEKGGRIGTGRGYYDQLIPELPVTTRKVSLAFECQIVPQVPIESHDKYVDIIVTESRIIYKI